MKAKEAAKKAGELAGLGHLLGWFKEITETLDRVNQRINIFLPLTARALFVIMGDLIQFILTPILYVGSFIPFVNLVVAAIGWVIGHLQILFYTMFLGSVGTEGSVAESLIGSGKGQGVLFNGLTPSGTIAMLMAHKKGTLRQTAEVKNENFWRTVRHFTGAGAILLFGAFLNEFFHSGRTWGPWTFWKLLMALTAKTFQLLFWLLGIKAGFVIDFLKAIIDNFLAFMGAVPWGWLAVVCAGFYLLSGFLNFSFEVEKTKNKKRVGWLLLVLGLNLLLLSHFWFNSFPTMEEYQKKAWVRFEKAYPEKIAQAKAADDLLWEKGQRGESEGGEGILGGLLDLYRKSPLGKLADKAGKQVAPPQKPAEGKNVQALRRSPEYSKLLNELVAKDVRGKKIARKISLLAGVVLVGLGIIFLLGLRPGRPELNDDAKEALIQRKLKRGVTIKFK